jgi:glutaredoxin-like protein
LPEFKKEAKFYSIKEVIMGIISEKDKDIIKKEFASLSGPVKLINFTQELECQYCRETMGLIKEISELSDKITTEVYNFITDKEATDTYKIDKIPATVITNGEDSGIRFYGIPSGYEFMTMLETIKMISTGKSGLSQESIDLVRELKKPIHLQVFVTPT